MLVWRRIGDRMTESVIMADIFIILDEEANLQSELLFSLSLVLDQAYDSHSFHHDKNK